MLSPLLLLLALPVSSVDKSKFKTCDQSSFCRRYRKYEKRAEAPSWKGAWFVDEAAGVTHLTEDSNRFGVTLRNRVYKERTLNLDLDFYLDAAGRCGVVRLLIDQNDPLSPRYRVPEGDVTMGDPSFLHPLKGQEIHWDYLNSTKSFIATDEEVERLTKNAPNGIFFHFSHDDESQRRCHVHIEFDPVRISVFKNGKELVALNARKLLNFEVERPRPSSSPQSKPERALDLADATEADASDLWEEKFNGFQDTKPRGPMAVGMDMTFKFCRHTYGLGGHSTTLDLPRFNEPYRLYNLDVFEYEVDSPAALYGSVPFLMGVHYQDNEQHKIDWGRSFVSGVLWANPSETYVKVDTPHFHEKEKTDVRRHSESWWISETGVIELWLLSAMNPHELMYKYHSITGFPHLPPAFALGKHQSRWNYEDEMDVKKVNRGFDDHDISYDVLWLDIEHTQAKKYFTWNHETFPQPKKLLEHLAQHKRQMVTIVDPHLKKESGWHLYDALKSDSLLVKRRGGQDFEGQCWPGNSVYPDFLNAKTRSAWAAQFAFANYEGSASNLYTWNDMNEPSVFNGPEVTMPKDALHFDESTGKFSLEHREVHNLYGQYVHRASFEGQLKRSPQQRPFVLSRSFFANSHRYGPIWTGDNGADFVHLAHSVPMLLSMAMSGQSFVGADVSGFFGDPSTEVYIRWHQLGALAYPFYRAHAHIETHRREPWLFGKDITELVREAVHIRYQLLPYWYTLFLEYAMGGRPIIRPVWFEHLEDSNTFKEGIQNTHIKVGDDLLVKAVAHSMGRDVNDHIYLPDSAHAHDGWFDYFTHDWKTSGMDHYLHVRPDKLPVYARAGSIIPKKLRRRRSVEAMSHDPYSLFVYCGVHPDHKPHTSARGRLYIDDGSSNGYKNGEFVYMNLDYSYSTLKSNALGLPTFKKEGDTRMYGTLDWPEERLRVEKIEFVGNTIAPERIVYYDDKSEQQLLFTVQDMGLSNPPRFHITVKNPPIVLGRYDWRIELQGLNFKNVRKHQDMVEAKLPKYGEF